MSTKRDTAVEGRTLKGNKAQESIGQTAAATRRSATDSDMEQSLEVEVWVERTRSMVATRLAEDAPRAGGWKRHITSVVGMRKAESTRLTARRQRLRRRSAAVDEGKALEGVNGESGKAARTAGSCKATGGRRGAKRLEPHGR